MGSSATPSGERAASQHKPHVIGSFPLPLIVPNYSESDPSTPRCPTSRVSHTSSNNRHADGVLLMSLVAFRSGCGAQIHEE
ncbi:hypothetical protein N7510_011264 [Penicillium lagena]|uniref:uncharacterized protein n=1 Tax=Penicillium lagena TaxID=94218 RepID=UPI00253FAD6A|nr:uncharacterized protein N7510_011264 [Penicillium lagena]KAJ5601730.1 hypothetical protein N7510_011264 [Penicillium lagena]